MNHGITIEGFRRLGKFPGADAWGLKSIDNMAERTQDYITRMDEQEDAYDVMSVSSEGGQHIFKLYPPQKLIIVYSDAIGLAFRRFRDEAQMQEVWQSMDEWVQQEHQRLREEAEARGETYYG